MPCRAWLLGDPDPFWLNDPSDVVLAAVEQAAPDTFIRLDMVPELPDEPARPTYVRAGRVSAVGALHPRQLAAAYDDPPDWLKD